MNPPLPIVQIAHTTFVWGAEVWPVADGVEPMATPLALVRGFASEGPDGASLQLRYGAGTGTAPAMLFGRGRSSADAELLARLVDLTFPSSHRLDFVDEAELAERLVPFSVDELGPAHVAEIRRVADVADDGRAVLLAWPVDAGAGELTSLVERAPSDTIVCLHLERTRFDPDLLAQLHGTVRDLMDEVEATADPSRVRALAAHRAWIRELPRAAVQLRVGLYAAEPLAPGLADLVGLTLAGARPGESGLTYEVVRPRTRQEIDLAIQLVDDLRSGPWATSEDPELDAIRPVFCSVEAAASFRLPSFRSPTGADPTAVPLASTGAGR